jgi:GNAT superfamily N-acetyltransferase
MELIIRKMEKRDAPQLEHLQRVVFPDLIPEERMKAEHFASHVDLFPEGQWVAETEGKIAGSTSSIRYHFNPAAPEMHRFADLFDDGFMRTHQPHGNWLYGMDMAVFPEFRGRGIARLLYRARQKVVNRLSLEGQVTVGMLNGFAAHAREYSLDEYYLALKNGTLMDPTVSVQQKIGFSMGALMKDYLTDPTCGNAGVLLVLPSSVDV